MSSDTGQKPPPQMESLQNLRTPNTSDGIAFPDDASQNDSPASSPTLSAAMPGTPLTFEFDLDLDDLSSFDLVGSDWIRLLSDSFSEQRDRLERTAVGRKFKKAVDAQKRVVNNQLRLLQLQQSPEAVKKRDKMAFVIGVTNMWVTTLLFGVLPGAVPWFYVTKTVVLLLTRLIVYRRKRWHYFMFDMCYYVNALLILFLVFPGSHSNLYAATWGLANGPVLIAITAWRNSLVFHSLDKVTSLLIHFDPPLTLFVLRWMAGNHCGANILPQHLVDLSISPPDITFAQIMLTSLATYLFWQAAYWVFVWTMRADKIKSGYATSTTWMLADHKSPVYRALQSVPPGYQPAMFMMIQLVYTLVTISPTYLFYRYQWLHAFALIGSMCMATYNGANYYFEVFSRKYIEQLKGLKRELDQVEVPNGNSNGGEQVEEKKLV